MKKRLISIILATICLVSCVMPLMVSATYITPRWDNAQRVNVSLYFTGTSYFAGIR